jgi:F-type H+-transporting ATPase subunit epsilon
LESATQYERIEQVVSFVGEDASGSFGILPGHARIMTILRSGLARFRVASGGWQFLAVPGATVYCANDHLHLSARRYLRDADYTRISMALREQLLAEEETLRAVTHSVRRLEEEMLKRMWKLRRGVETRI